ncbi:5,10-methylenetetrahydrofolate reductase (NAD(P)) [Plasticicumulans acidivorans]|uniref:Methylenetetrahydrofolate reductase n=2 Tax=Plasticicumulans acidivorans TaxID=886464 RepID=A0A317MXM2_9GAMM|nr:5,10-methylenetetrahydrofolate reductase (NAD(P)) [Plasticicumulans acidivorans]
MPAAIFIGHRSGDSESMDTQRRYPQVCSCEFFPPHSEDGLQKLLVTSAELDALRPAFRSVTYGAGGSTRERTFVTVTALGGLGIDAAPHLTCVGSTRAGIAEILEEYRVQGVRRIVALRGDVPSGMRDIGDFRYANELIEFIRASTGEHFHLEIAAYPEYHPQSSRPERDLDNFARKVQAGANSAITQYFYNADAYFHFIDEIEARGVDIPVVPGIMPITNFTQLARFSDACGTEIPRWMRRQLEAYGEDRDAIRAFGLDVVTALCERLLAAGAPGLHFYTMNQSGPTLEIASRLGLLQA